MGRPYELKVPENYRVHLDRNTLPDLYHELGRRGVPVTFFSARPGYVKKGETSLAEACVIYGRGFQLSAHPVVEKDGSKLIRGKITVKEGSNVNAEGIEGVVARFSIRRIPALRPVPVAPGAPPSGF